MFAWASNTFEKVIQTVAPAPTDGNTKILYFCQQGDEQGALQCLQQPPESSDVTPIDPIRSVVVQSKGYTPLHLACLHTMPALLDYILTCNHSRDYVWQIQDAEGNSPLHCACMSNNPNALQMVKSILLHRVDGVSNDPPTVNVSLVLAKNFRGETPYDVAVLNSVRQYLLPIQLQAETQAAIDSGGIGLPPGIDMGGLKINYSNLPPPPSFAGSPYTNPSHSAGAKTSRYAAPPIPGMGGPSLADQQTANSRYAAPPIPGMGGPSLVDQQTQNVNTSFTQVHAPQPPQQSVQTPPFQQPSAGFQPTVQSQYAFNPQAGSSPTISAPNASTAAVVGTNAPPEAPKSSDSGYSLSGRSSIAMHSGSRGRYLPNDGFHSSSSDKNLQAKYGHSVVAPSLTIAPPPSSGNAGLAVSISAAQSPAQSAPPSMNTASLNPFAAGESALGSRRLPAGSRYVSYDPIRGTSLMPLPPPPPPPPGPRGIGLASAAPTFSVFNPLGSNGTNMAGAPVPPPYQQQSMPSSNNYAIPPLPPPPSIGSRTTASNNQISGSNADAKAIFSPNNHILVQPTPANTPIIPGPSPTQGSSPSPTKAATLFGSPIQGSSSQGHKESPSFRISKPPNSGNASDVFAVPQGVHSSVSSSGGSSNAFGSPQRQIVGSVDKASNSFSAPPITPSSIASNPSSTFSSPLLDSTLQTSSQVDKPVSSSSMFPGTNAPSVASVFGQPAPILPETEASNEPLVTPRATVDDHEPSAAQDEDDEGMMDEIPLTPWTEQERKPVTTTFSEQQTPSSAILTSGSPIGNGDSNLVGISPPVPPFHRN